MHTIRHFVVLWLIALVVIGVQAQPRLQKVIFPLGLFEVCLSATINGQPILEYVGEL